MSKKLCLHLKILTHRVLLHIVDICSLNKSQFELSIIVLNYQRKELLERTLKSLEKTRPTLSEIIIVDNASTDGSQEWLMSWAQQSQQHKIFLNSKNQGGEGLNQALRTARGQFVLISENDFEYQSGWFDQLKNNLMAFPKLGLLSPLSAFPDLTNEETWAAKSAKKIEANGYQVYEAMGNIGTSCFFQRSLLLKLGLYFRSLVKEGADWVFPDDGQFSAQVQEGGYVVAWSEKAVARNLGHSQLEWNKNPDYYKKNWQIKSQFSMDGLGRMNSDDMQFVLGKAIHEIESLKSRYLILQKNFADKKLLKTIGIEPETSRLFYDTGDGFQPENYIQEKLSPFLDKFEIKFILEDLHNIKKLRWDPIEGDLIKLRIDNIFAKTKTGSVSLKYTLNDHQMVGSEIHFKSADPQVFLSEISKEATELVVQGFWDYQKTSPL